MDLRHAAALWPDLPDDIAVARLRFIVDELLASAAASSIVMPDEIRAARSRRRADFLAGRLCARAAIRCLTDRDTSVARTTNGAPCWPAGLTGSISHAGGQAIAIVARTARYRSLGVDVERLLPLDQATALAPTILRPAEQHRFVGAPRQWLATLAFSLKEALFKALHPLSGTMFFHHDAEITLLDESGRAQMKLVHGLSPEWRDGHVFSAHWCAADSYIFSMIAVERDSSLIHAGNAAYASPWRQSSYMI